MANEMFKEISPVLYQNRYCSQEDFHVIIDGIKNRRQGRNIRNVYKVKFPTVDEILESSSTFSYADVTVTSGLNIWTICARRTVSEHINAFRNSVQMNDLTFNLLQTKRVCFCACSFMNNLYLFGGYASDGVVLKTCLKYDTRCSSWNKISNMNDGREHAACAVFEGKVVVSGGRNNRVEFRFRFKISRSI